MADVYQNCNVIVYNYNYNLDRSIRILSVICQN